MLDFESFSRLTIYDLLKRTQQKYPDHLAVIDGPLKLTYTELKQSADSFAALLHKKGFQKGDRIGLMLPNCVHYVIAYYAAMRLGGTVVQVNPSYQSSELEHMIDDATPKWFVCHRDQQEKIDRIDRFKDIEVFYTRNEKGEEQLLADSPVDELPEVDINPKEHVAVIQYTGGTTGRSKGAMLTHYNIICNIHQSGSVVAPRIKEGEERILGVSPLTHAMAMTNMNFTVLIGATYVILEKFNATKVLELINDYRLTYFLGSPTMYIALLNHPDLPKYDVSSLKVCISGSAPLPVEVLKQLDEKFGASIFEGYGLSEATTSVTRTPIKGKRKIGSVGVPIPGTEVKLVDVDNGIDEVPEGELIVKGPQVMKGYWNNPEATKEALRNGWLYTGDIARKDEDGYYYIVGRKKDMVIAGGLNIYPAEVEEVLYQHPDIAEVCVYGVPDEYLGERLLAAVVLKDGSNLTEQELLDWCAPRLARYKIPRGIEFRKELPKSIVGKILRRKLVEEFVNKQNIAN